MPTVPYGWQFIKKIQTICCFIWGRIYKEEYRITLLSSTLPSSTLMISTSMSSFVQGEGECTQYTCTILNSQHGLKRKLITAHVWSSTVLTLPLSLSLDKNTQRDLISRVELGRVEFNRVLLTLLYTVDSTPDCHKL